MGLRDIGNTLPPGFRFYPSDEELVCHYLYNKVANEQVQIGTLVEIDLHTCEPWQLPDVAKLNSNEWYFFSFRDRKYATGYRTNRATISGYWKATGKDRPVLDPRTRAVVGMRKTLVFYKNRAPNGVKTAWIMHEFRLENPHLPPKEDWVLCRVFYKSRSENNNSYDLNDDAFGLTANNNSSCNVEISPTNEPSASVYHNNITTLFTQNPCTALGLSALDAGYGVLCHEDDEPNRLSVTTTYDPTKIIDHVNCDNEYGFLFDMKLDNLNAVPAGLDDLRFGDNFV